MQDGSILTSTHSKDGKEQPRVVAIGGMPWPPAAYLVQCPPLQKLFYARDREAAVQWALERGGGHLFSLGCMFAEPEIIAPDFAPTQTDSQWHGG